MTVAALYELSRTAIVPSLVIEEDGLKKAMAISGHAWLVMQAVGSSMGDLITQWCLIHLEDKGEASSRTKSFVAALPSSSAQASTS
eukprot:scaffold8528_cov85-Skeletonema_dohrnii-CCMP3373.AAC.4